MPNTGIAGRYPVLDLNLPLIGQSPPSTMLNRTGLMGGAAQQAAISAADAVWILGNAFRIFTMQSGFSLLEAGHVSSKNIANIMVKNMLDVCFGGISYWVFGYGLSFGAPSNWFCGWGNFFAEAPDNEQMGAFYAHYVFQFSFATAATTIVSGAVAERMKLSAYILFSMLNTFVYCIPAAWVWNKNGFLYVMGFHDFAGASVVHLTGGASALVAAVMLGPRTGRFDKRHWRRFEMHSPVTALSGTFILWWAWLSFSCGSTYSVDSNGWHLAAKVGINTLNGSIAGGITGVLLSLVWTRGRHYRIDFIINGVLAGLVSVTAGAAVLRPTECLLVGSAGAVATAALVPLLLACRVDDPVGACAVHGGASVIGLLLVGVFGRDIYGKLSVHQGWLASGSAQLLAVQAAGTGIIIIWSAAATFVLFGLLSATIGVRLSLSAEQRGADQVEHGILEPLTFSAKLEEAVLNRIKGNQPPSARPCQADETSELHRDLDMELHMLIERLMDVDRRDVVGFVDMPKHSGRRYSLT